MIPRKDDRKFSSSKLVLCFPALAAIPFLLTLIPGIFQWRHEKPA